jgi:hypothetical protein
MYVTLMCPPPHSIRNHHSKNTIIYEFENAQTNLSPSNLVHRGVITILGTKIESEEWVTKRKDAQKFVAKKLVDIIPMIKIGDDIVPNKKMDAYVVFQYP